MQPATSWLEANRTLSYLAAFAGAAMLARLAPNRWPAVLGALGAVTAVVCGYALLAKVFPATLNANDTLGRLRVPFGYWNATGLMAALGLPACLWAGTRPATGRLLRSLTVPALAVLLTTLVLSYSRGAVLAAVIGLGCWFALVPLRLRATLLLALGALGGAVATLYALGHHAITHDNASLAARTAAGHDFGVVLLVVVILSAFAGFAATLAMDRVALPAPVRRRIGTVLLIGVALVPVAAVAGAAASSRGLTGEVSHVWSTLTSTTPSSGVGNNPGRLAQLSNSRPLYWHEGLKVGEHALLAGAGAGGFDTARTRYTTNPLAVAHAHSYAIETFADFGLIGIAVSLALLIAWGAAVRRALTPTRPDAPEWIGMVTLLAVVVTYAVSSLIDWTWFIPGVTVPALVCAGWLAGRGPLSDGEPAVDVRPAATSARTRSRRPARTRGRRPARTRDRSPTQTPRGWPAARSRRGRHRDPRRRPDRRLVRVAAAALLRPGHRRDRRHDPRRCAGRPDRRPERRRQRPGVGRSAVGARGDLFGHRQPGGQPRRAREGHPGPAVQRADLAAARLVRPPGPSDRPRAPRARARPAT